MGTRIANALIAYATYLGKTFWPHPLTVFYPYPETISWGAVATAAILLLGISLLAFRFARIHPYLLVGWLWFLGTLLPVIGLVQVGAQSMADRYTYIPLIGLFIMIVWGIPQILSGPRRRRSLVLSSMIPTPQECHCEKRSDEAISSSWDCFAIARNDKITLFVASATVLSLLVLASRSQVNLWQNNITLYEHTLRFTPGNFIIHNNLANALAQQGRTADSIPHYAAALRLRPDHPRFHYNLANALARQEKVNEAIQHYTRAIKLKPYYAEAKNNLGVVLDRLGKIQEAKAQYAQALHMKPDYADAQNNLGTALAKEGNLQEAVAHFSEALRIDPAYAKAEQNLKTALTEAWQHRKPTPTNAPHVEKVNPAKANEALKNATVRANLLKLPLSFEENQGQTDPKVDFLARGSGYTLFLIPTGPVLDLRSSHSGAVLKMNLVEANPQARAKGLDKLPGKSNYFIGNAPKKWRTNIPKYKKVKYENIYPRVDLVYYGTERHLEYDLIVAPGADPGQIVLGFEGYKKLVLEEGDIVIQMPGGDREIRMHKPRIYQEIDGIRRSVPGEYRLEREGRIRFEVAAYDQSRPLIIDPDLTYSTFLGGSGNDYGYGIAVDSSRNAYVTGYTPSTNFPTTSGAYDTSYNGGSNDAFVTKLNSDGTGLSYSTFLGGSANDQARAIAVDSSGNAYVTGHTASTNFPTTSGVYDTSHNGGDDAFVTKLNSDGTGLVYSTFLGGSGSDYGRGIAVLSGSAYVAGYTDSSNFPTTSGAYKTSNSGGTYDAFVTKVSADGSALSYSTYLGGSGEDQARAVAVESGYAYVTGYTGSNNFPTTSGAYDTSYNGGTNDVFVTKLNSDGTGLAYSTYIGGSNTDRASGIAVLSGNAYVTGDTLSSNFPTTSGAYDTSFDGGLNDGFVTKLTSDGSALSYSTFLGGSKYDYGTGIAVDSSGNAYVTGFTQSTDFPVTPGAYDTSYNGDLYDAIFSKINSSGSGLDYSTYLGGNSEEEGLAIALDSSGKAYITGYTASNDFPTTSGAYDTSFNGGLYDVFISKFSIGSPPPSPGSPTLLSKVGTFTTPSSTGLATAVNIGFQTKVIFFWVTHTPADTIAESAWFSQGWAADSGAGNSQHGAVSWSMSSEFDCRPPDMCGRVRSYIGSGKAFRIMDDTGTIRVDAYVDSITSSQFQLYYTSASAAYSGLLVGYLALGGSALENVKVGSFDDSGSANGATLEISNIGFIPDIVLLMGLHDDTQSYAPSTNASFATGVAYCLTGDCSTKSAASVGHRQIYQLGCTIGCGTSGLYDSPSSPPNKALVFSGGDDTNWPLIYGFGTIDSSNGGRFTITKDTGTTSNKARMFYLALQGTNLKKARGRLVQPTASPPQNQTISDLGFASAAVLFSGGGNNDADNPTYFQGAAITSYGAANVATEFGFWTGQGTTNPGDNLSISDSYSSNTYSIVHYDSGNPPVLSARAQLSSITSDGFTLNWDTTDAKDRFHNWIALGPLASPGNTVASTTLATATIESQQRKTFYASDRYWVFYSDGTNMVYKSSADGMSWSSATTVRACTDGNKFSVWYDGTYVHYAYASATSNTALFYRRGSISGSTINWETERTAAAKNAKYTYYYPMVTVDSSGYPWIGYLFNNNGPQTPYVTKSSTNDGTWTTATGFPAQLSSTSYSEWRVFLVPMTSQRIGIFYGYPGVLYAKIWNGSMGNQEYVADIATGHSVSGVNIDDDIYLVYSVSLSSSLDCNKRPYSSGTWTSCGTVQPYIPGDPVLTVQSATGQLHAFWSGYPGGTGIYYKRYSTVSGTWDSDPSELVNEYSDYLTSSNSLTAFYTRDYSANIGVLYETKTASPYNIKFASFEPTVVKLSSFTTRPLQNFVEVQWVTKSEVNNLGFNLYRTSGNGPSVKLNLEIIPGLLSSVRGKAYSYADREVVAGTPYCYTLEDIDLSAKRTRHGPVCVSWAETNLPEQSPAPEEAPVLEGENSAAGLPVEGPEDAPTATMQGGVGGQQSFLSSSGATRVLLTSFGATSQDGKVLVEWTTGMEVHNLGFHLFREENGSLIRLTDQFIAGSALLTGNRSVNAGRSYSWLDNLEKGSLALEERPPEAGSRTANFVRSRTGLAGLEDRGKGLNAALSHFTSSEALLEHSAPPAQRSFVYWLEDIDLSGKRTWHGPITPVVSQEPLPPKTQALLMGHLSQRQSARDKSLAKAQTLKNRMRKESQTPLSPHSPIIPSLPSRLEGKEGGGQVIRNPKSPPPLPLPPPRGRVGWGGNSAIRPALRGMPGSPEPHMFQGAMEMQWHLASLPGVKIFIQQEGWYRVPQPELTAAGLPPGIHPRLLQLYSNGLEQPIKVSTREKDRFGPGDYLEFYGTGGDTPFTDARVYWVVAGEKPGKRIGRAPSIPSHWDGPSSFLFTAEEKPRIIYFPALMNGETENFFGPVVWNEPLDHTISLHHLAPNPPGPAILEVALQGLTIAPHRVRVLLNGQDAGVLSLPDQTRGFTKMPVSQSMLLEGENCLTLIGEEGEMDISLVDYVRISYWRTYTAYEDFLRFTTGGGQSIAVSGFTGPAIRVIEITDPQDVQEVTGMIRPGPEGFSIQFKVPGRGQRTFLAFMDENALSPAALAANGPSNWHHSGHGADLVIITRQDLLEGLSPLKTLREAQGLTVALIDVENLYDEFAFGMKTPQAIQDFLKQARTSWSRPPRFVLLAGDATYDPRNYLGFGDFDLISTRLVDTAYLETACDDCLADFDGDGLPELAVGRLPARTPEELEILVSKILAYEQAPSSQKEALLVADIFDGDFNFGAASARMRSLLPPDFHARELLRGSFADDDQVHQEILAGLNRGPLLVNYVGHGSLENWRGDILTTADGPALSNLPRFSFFVPMTCLNGFYHEAYPIDSLAEALIKAPDGGAIAVWASSGMTLPEGQAQMNQEMIRQLLSPESLTIGEAAIRAKAATPDRDVRKTWILFGDPSSRLRY